MPPAMSTPVTGSAGLAARAASAGLALVLLAAVPAAQAQKKMTLNDTGQTQCNINGVFSTDCKGTGQDADYGRDVTDNPGPGDRGVAGFAFEKVCNSGEREGTGQCLPKAQLGSGPNDWGCTRDKVTKLIWEVKTADGGLRDKNRGYTNYGDNRSGDASAFVAAVNTQGLCGASTWRLPTVVELQSLVNYGVAYPGPTIDTKWFPNTRNTWFWTSEGYADDTFYAWSVGFYNGVTSYSFNRDYDNAVRLVRAGQ